MLGRKYWPVPVLTLTLWLSLGVWHRPEHAISLSVPNKGERQEERALDLFVADSAQPPAPAAASPADQGQEKAGPSAGMAMLDRLLESLHPAKARWLQLKIWQRMRHEDIDFEAEGLIALAPHQCARVDMVVSSSETRSRILLVSNSQHLVRSIRTGPRPAEVDILELPHAPDTQDPGQIHDRDHFLQIHGCGGPHTLLTNLRQRLKVEKECSGAWKGLRVLRVCGQVQAESAATPDGRNQPYTEGEKSARATFLRAPRAGRHCVLYLDAETGWPHRIEWWSTDRQGQAAVVLLQLELRDPIFNRRPDIDEFVRLFAYRPD